MGGKSGQGSLEFLMTYGWAVLVVIVAVGSLNFYYFSGSSSVTPETCFLGPGLGCNDFAIYEDSLSIVIINSLGRDLGEVSIQNSNCLSLTDPITLDNNEERILVLEGCNFNGGDFVSEDIELTYSFIGSSIDHLREASLTTVVQGAVNSILFLETDLEETLIPDYWNIQKNNSESIVIVDDIVRNGDYALKFNVDYLEFGVPFDVSNNKSRAELSIEDITANLYPMDGRPIFYGWSIYFPLGYEYNVSAPDRYNIVGQWFHRPDIANGETWEDWFIKYDNKRMPPSVHVEYEELITGQRGIGIAWKETPETPATNIGDVEINLGEWNDLIFEIKWSTETDGYIRAWLNGVMFTEKLDIINMYNPTPKKLKVGLYRGPSARMENTVYYDDIRIGGSYEEVDPNNY
ncbi:hypothetical protein HOM13_03865 [Candidatus Woesearchaeota archaeon]|nr:hypothetical protein [Candidatus Woesearchaeota archaeon]MBT5215846.1 hypothetical protein [Candidatus Woesearchaeota archaeon]MBT6402374.1 hypothetical protein [Candidatus Woesearchaeota archaeon]